MLRSGPCYMQMKTATALPMRWNRQEIGYKPQAMRQIVRLHTTHTTWLGKLRNDSVEQPQNGALSNMFRVKRIQTITRSRSLRVRSNRCMVWRESCNRLSTVMSDRGAQLAAYVVHRHRAATAGNYGPVFRVSLLEVI